VDKSIKGYLMNYKNVFLTLCFVLTSSSSMAMSCVAMENGKKLNCNNYDQLKQKDPSKLQKLCSMGDMDTPYMKMKGIFSKTKCDSTGATAKCKVKGHDTTFYFSNDFASLEKGCKMYPNSEYVKL
jgi:hypothetical protein